MGKPEKNRKKRDAKKREARKQANNPLKRVVDAPGPIECWATPIWGNQRQASILVYKQAAGINVIGCFLIDRGVAGLKDAYILLNRGREELQYIIQQISQNVSKPDRIDHAEAFKMITGAARWADDNGMRLPKHWIRYAEILGDVSDWKSADVSKFEMEFVGNPKDLMQRLVSSSYADYVKRADISFQFSVHTDYIGDEDDWSELPEKLIDEKEFERIMPELIEDAKPIARQLEQKVSAWLRSRNEIPHEQLHHAAITMLLAVLLASHISPHATGRRAGVLCEACRELLTNYLTDEQYEEYDKGLVQLESYVTSNRSDIDAIMKSCFN